MKTQIDIENARFEAREKRRLLNIEKRRAKAQEDINNGIQQTL